METFVVRQGCHTWHSSSSNVAWCLLHHILVKQLIILPKPRHLEIQKDTTWPQAEVFQDCVRCCFCENLRPRVWPDTYFSEVGAHAVVNRSPKQIQLVIMRWKCPLVYSFGQICERSRAHAVCRYNMAISKVANICIYIYIYGKQTIYKVKISKSQSSV